MRKNLNLTPIEIQKAGVGGFKKTVRFGRGIKISFTI